MRSIKAIFAGSLFILVIIVLVQLAYVFLAVGYTQLAEHFPFLNKIGGWLRYLIGIPILFLVMAVGGYITAGLAKTNVLLHCLLVALISNSMMMISALQNMELTITGLVVLVLGLMSTVGGGWYWQRAKKQ